MISGPSQSLALVVASDKKFLPHMTTAVFSAALSNPDFIGRVFLLSHDIKNEDLEAINASLKLRADKEIELVRVDSSRVADLYVSHHVSTATYLRFSIAETLPQDVTVALYIDCDTVTVGSLSELDKVVARFEESDSSNSWLGAACRESSGSHLNSFGFSSTDYFNAGVLLINLTQWRKENIAARLFSKARDLHAKLPWWDQDVLNLVMESRWLKLDNKFNATWVHPGEDVRIAHFSGREKPWHFGCSHPLRGEYDCYRRETPHWPYLKSGLAHHVKKTLTPKWWRPAKKYVKRHTRRVARHFRIV